MLQLTDIHCGYDGTAVLQGLDFKVAEGEIACLLGPSGCGKSTALRTIAGFESISNGSITLRDRLMADARHSVPPEKRNLGMVFQDYALFPHLTVADNIGFGIRKLAAGRRRQRVLDLLQQVRLDNCAGRYPDQLSGGQQQRVALARALASKPDMVLLDEPFSNLDRDLRRRLGRELREILKAGNTTALLVTHDQEEAFMLADRVGVMRDGRIEQWDTPYGLYHRPVSRYVAEFTGQGHFLAVRRAGPRQLQSPLGQISGDLTGADDNAGELVLLIRPDDVQIAPPDEAGDQSTPMTIVDKAFQGAETLYTLQHPDGWQLQALMPSHAHFDNGQVVAATLNAQHLVVFRND